MRFHNTVTAALFFIGVACPANIPSSHVLHEKRSFVPSEWAKRSRAPPDATLPVRIGITPRNSELGHNHLMAISDPTSPDFGKHWTPKQVHDFFSPSAEAVTAVQKWLESSGIHIQRHKVAPTRSHIRFEASVEEMESLLGTQYDMWEHVASGSISVSCDQYQVPRSIKHHIDFITPTVGFDRPRSPAHHRQQKRSSPFGEPILFQKPGKPSQADNLTECSELVSPACIKALYEIPPPTTAVKGNEMGIYETGDTYDQEDLDLFFRNYTPNIPNGTHPILQAIDGGTAPVPVQQAGSESLLDIELAYPLIYPQQIKLYQTLDVATAEGINATLGIFDPFLDALDNSYCTFEGGDDPNIDPHFPDGVGYNGTEECGIYKPTNVISVSYELAEATYPQAYVERQCHEYMKLGLLGTSLVFASGDNGTLSRAGANGCLADGAQNPSFPSSCPYGTNRSPSSSCLS